MRYGRGSPFSLEDLVDEGRRAKPPGAFEGTLEGGTNSSPTSGAAQTKAVGLVPGAGIVGGMGERVPTSRENPVGPRPREHGAVAIELRGKKEALAHLPGEERTAGGGHWGGQGLSASAFPGPAIHIHPPTARCWALPGGNPFPGWVTHVPGVPTGPS